MTHILEQIKTALLNNEMSYDEAANLIYDNKKKPWHTKDWQEKRMQLIKDNCEQCGKSQPPLVLQHMWHPHSYKDIIREVYHSKYFPIVDQELVSDDSEDQQINQYLERFKDERYACPKCSRLSISERKTMVPKFKCIKCRHEFDEPLKLAYSNELGKIKPSFEEVKASLLRKRKEQVTWERYGEDIRKEALYISIEEHQRYISLQDTKTFCKKCTFLWDMKRKKVCEVCKENIIPIPMHACRDCQKEGHPSVI